jgi:peptidoglycan hydrolase-like protein with peptidoglycan-binding domain
MNSPDRRRTLATIAAAVAVSALVLGACSSSKKESTSTTTSGSSGTTLVSGATAAFDKDIQQQLADVGCYTGNVDGILGPESDAAIVAFQTAAGLTVDGQLGPETEAALKKDAAAKTKVCGTSTTTTSKSTTTTAAGGTAPCTATALLTALDTGSKLTSYVCAEGYAGVKATAPDQGGTQQPYQAVLKSESGTWTDLGEQPCGTASAGIPPQVLEMGCAA